MIAKLFNYKPLNENVLSDVGSVLTKHFQFQPFEYPKKETIYTIAYKKSDDKIVFLIKYGKNNLNECYKRDEQAFDHSILNENTIHMTNQIVFAIKQDCILCSDDSKKNLIFNMITSAEKSFSCHLMARLESIDEFVKNLTSVDSISIDATNDLFINEFLNPTWYDSFDQEIPKTTTVKLTFDRAIRESIIKKFYKKLKDTSYVTGFNIKGENENGLISINKDRIISKQEYDFKTDGEGYYDIEDIFAKL